MIERSNFWYKCTWKWKLFHAKWQKRRNY